MYEIVLRLTPNQASLLVQSLEAMSRILSGDVHTPVADHAYEILSAAGRYNSEARDSAEGFARAVNAVLTGLPGNAGYGIFSDKITDRARQAFDLMRTIRNGTAKHDNPSGTSLHGVHYDEVDRTSTKEPLPGFSVKWIPDSDLTRPTA